MSNFVPMNDMSNDDIIRLFGVWAAMTPDFWRWANAQLDYECLKPESAQTILFEVLGKALNLSDGNEPQRGKICQNGMILEYYIENQKFKNLKIIDSSNSETLFVKIHG